MIAPIPAGFETVITVAGDEISLAPSTMNGNTWMALGIVRGAIDYRTSSNDKAERSKTDQALLEEEIRLPQAVSGQLKLGNVMPDRDDAGALRLTPAWATVAAYALLESTHRTPTAAHIRESIARQAGTLAMVAAPFYESSSPVVAQSLLSLTSQAPPTV